MDILFGKNQFETPGLTMTGATWDDLVQQCEACRHIVRPAEDKWKTGWVSPAILYRGATSRKLSDVERMAGWIGLDVDHANWSLAELQTYLRGLVSIAYSTTRSTASERRWRVLVPMSRSMTTAEFTGVWQAWNELLEGQVDASTKNFNRLHYLPAAWIGGNNEYHVQNGGVMDVDRLLESCPPEEPAYYREVFQTAGVQRPDGTEIITEAMIERHMFGPHGGRFFKLMCAAATMHKANGWALSASELANAALSVSPRDSSGMARAMSALREAERVLSYINSRVENASPKDRLIAALKWKWQQQKTAPSDHP